MPKLMTAVSMILLFGNVSLAQIVKDQPTLPEIFAVEAGIHADGVPDVIINPLTGNVTVDYNNIEIKSIVINSDAGIFNGWNSPNWDSPDCFCADLDSQISFPISFIRPSFSGVDDLGNEVIGNWPADFDYFADLTIKYLEFDSGEILDGDLIVVPEPNEFILLALGCISLIPFLIRRLR